MKVWKNQSNFCMQREVLKYLLDIKESIDSIYFYLGDKRDSNSYKADKLLRRGIERELEIIREATNRVLKIDSSINIEDARRIVNLRNWVIQPSQNRRCYCMGCTYQRYSQTQITN